MSVHCFLFVRREKVRQFELPTSLAASKANPAFSTPSCRPQLTNSQAALPVTADNSSSNSKGALTVAAASEVQLQLNQDLVAATVKLDSATRRLEVLERDKERLNKSLEEAQVGVGCQEVGGKSGLNSRVRCVAAYWAVL